MTKLTTPLDFDALLMKLQRALRGADDLDAASALIALLFHRLLLLDSEARLRAQEGIAALLRADAQYSKEISLTEGPRRSRLLRAMH